jgi:hypothetical protein
MKRETTIGDLNPHVDVLLDMADQQETDNSQNDEAVEEDSPSLFHDAELAPSKGEEAEAKKRALKKDEAPPTPGEMANKITDTILGKPKKPRSIFDDLKEDFDPDDVRSSPRAKNDLLDKKRQELEDSRSGEVGTSPESTTAQTLDELLVKMGIDDDPIDALHLASETPPKRGYSTRTPRGKGAETITEKKLDEDSPEAELLKILQDAGITRGKVFVVEQFFSKGFSDDTEAARWLNSVMAEAGVSPQKRRMVILGWFKNTPEALDVNINRTGTKAGGDKVDDILEGMAEDEAQELKRLTQRKKLDDARESLGLPTGRKKSKKPDDDDEDELIEVPIKEPNGSFSKDVHGKPIVMKMTKKEYFWLKQEEASRNAAKSDNGDSTQKTIMEMIKSQHERDLASQERFNKLVQEMHENRVASEKQLLGYMLQREHADKEQLKAGYRSEEDILDAAEKKFDVWEKLGVITRGKETSSDIQSKAIKETRESFTTLYNSVKGDAKEMFGWIRDDIKEERRQKNPQLVNDSRVPETDKENFYREVANMEAGVKSVTSKKSPPDALANTSAVEAILAHPDVNDVSLLENTEDKKDGNKENGSS